MMNGNNNLNPQAPLPDTITILRNSWQLYQERFNTLMAIILPMFLVDLLSIFLLKNLLPSFIIDIFDLIIVSWVYVSLVSVLVSERKISAYEAYLLGKSRVLPLVWLEILGGVFLVVGFLLLIIPGLIFAVWWSLSLFVLVDEDLRGLKAISQARIYVKGKWWGVFGRLVFIWLIAFVPSIIGILLARIAFPAQTSIISSFLNTLLTPLITIYGFLIYKHLRSSKLSEVLTPPR